MKQIISFPRLGNYHIPISSFLEKTTKQNILIPPNITNNTKELGTKYSPDFVCAPFKYNLGNYIEALDNGATILLQGGGGCRYGYYAELQEQILKDLGYKFEFKNFIKNNSISPIKVYQFIKEVNPKANVIKCLYYGIILLIKVVYMDKIENYIRKNKAIIINKERLKILEKKYYNNINTPKTIITNLLYNIKTYKKLKKEPKEKKAKPLKIALIGELYTLMESEASSNLEELLIKQNISIFRNTNITYLMITKKHCQKRLAKKGKEYVKYHLGADATENIILTKLLAKKYDGIIHIKSFGCTPEINAMPIISKVSKDYQVPVMFLTFDTSSTDLGLETRIEAFCDMLKSRNRN